MDLALQGGFPETVMDAQAVFRAIMNSLANPGRPQPLAALATPPAPLTSELGAVALTLSDHDTRLWLDPALAGSQPVRDWLAFHCGAPLVADPAAADFALVAESAHLPPLEQLGQGSDEYPDRSTTLVLATGPGRRNVRLVGPGIRDRLDTALPLPGGDFLAQWAGNRARFPRGIDLLLVGDGVVTGLPRSTRISEA